MCFERKRSSSDQTTPARLWSRARQRLVETDHISFSSSKESRLQRKPTKRNNYNEKTEIGVAAEMSEKNPETKEIML